MTAVCLAAEADGIAFFGELDQTIYEWRGSKPDEVIQRVKADFGPVTELSLHDNYRATKALLRVSDRHASIFAHRRTQTLPAQSLPDGFCPEVNHAENSASEAQWIATRIRNNLATRDLGKSASSPAPTSVPRPSLRPSPGKRFPTSPWSNSISSGARKSKTCLPASACS